MRDIKSKKLNLNYNKIGIIDLEVGHPLEPFPPFRKL